MKTRYLLLLVTLAAMVSACGHYDDFDFTGTVVDYEECNTVSDFGYAISLSSPDSIGANYMTRGNEVFGNVVVVYGADRFLHEGDQVSGRIYMDPNYSKTSCMYHFTREAPEARFTKLKIVNTTPKQ